MQPTSLEVVLRITRDATLNLGSGWLAVGFFSLESASYPLSVRIVFIGTNISLGLACFVLAYTIERTSYE